MAGRLTVNKPSRSDELLDRDEQLKMAEKIRALFDSTAPKRPMKPSRSESDSSTPNLIEPNINENIPELNKLRSLQSQTHDILAAEGGPEVKEDYVETQYYKELDSILKQHHTTGNGFIKLVSHEGAEGYETQLRNGFCGDCEMVRSGLRSNPATNDWVPTVSHPLVFTNPGWKNVFASSKPNRSESS